MFASQLLRILQTIPADANYETRVFDIPAVKLTMKENQNEIPCPSNGFEEKVDVDDDGNGNASPNASVLDCSEVVDTSTNSNDKEATDCQKLGDQEEPSCLSNGFERDLKSSTVNDDQTQSNSDIERSIVIDSCTDSGEKGAGDSEIPETSFYADKSVRECEVPEVTVCYKDGDYHHIIKDICVDEGVPTQEKTLIETEAGEDTHNGTAKGCHGIEASADGFEVSTVEHIRNCAFSEDGTKEVDVATYYFLDGSKPSVEEDVMKVPGPGNLKQMTETDLSTAERMEEDESSASSRNSVQEPIPQDALRHSSNDDEIEAPQQQIDEVPSVEAILESLAVAFASDDPKKNVGGNKLQYNSKVEGGTITFDFNSAKLDASAENRHRESLQAEQHVNDKHKDLDEKPAATLPQGSTTSHAEKAEDVNGNQGSLDDYSAAALPRGASNAEKADDVNGNLDDNSAAASLPQGTSNADKAEEVNGKQGDLDDNSTATFPQRLSNAENNKNADEPKGLPHTTAEHSRQIHRGGGESSFSSSGPGLITYSGPIVAYSGSISLRSESSSTSTRSFAFPVLQSEWNSSPVRMVKADRRHYRKHNKGWRQGLFCCRF